MYLFDTHTHLDAPQFDEDREEVIARAVEAGVSKMINIDLIGKRSLQR